MISLLSPANRKRLAVYVNTLDQQECTEAGQALASEIYRVEKDIRQTPDVLIQADLYVEGQRLFEAAEQYLETITVL